MQPTATFCKASKAYTAQTSVNLSAGMSMQVNAGAEAASSADAVRMLSGAHERSNLVAAAA